MSVLIWIRQLEINLMALIITAHQVLFPSSHEINSDYGVLRLI